MPFLNRDNARIYYEDTGHGEPIIALHGLIENTMYWTPVGGILSKSCRFIAMDMRAHGLTTIEGEPYGFDADTVGEDIITLADHLGLKRFHLLTHSSGGFASIRYAMRDSSRFATLILTDTGSATAPVPVDSETIRQFNDAFARWFEKNSWDQVINKLKIKPGPFFRGIMESENSEDLMRLSYEMIRKGDRMTIAAFIRSYYTDPNPHLEGLRKINCPVLIIYGEKDDLFIESSKLMSREIPGAQIIEYKGIGHMTAYEAPEHLARDVLSYVLAYPV
jgi:pimeloyl-ACP methyl ester carboxylesterase